VAQGEGPALKKKERKRKRRKDCLIEWISTAWSWYA
jgi:hypothetical protein